jgi:hypothetical protein
VWLEVTSHHDRGFNIMVARQPQRLMLQARAQQKQPSLFVFLGRNTRRAAVRTMWTSSSLSRGPRRHSGFHMHLDAQSVFGERPILVVESDLITTTTAEDKPMACHKTDHLIIPRVPCSLPRRSNSLPSPHATLCARVLCPFAEVVCIFLADYPDLGAVVEEVGAWIEMGMTTTVANVSAKPHLLLVADVSSPVSQEAFVALLAQVSENPYTVAFSQISVVPLHHERSMSPKSRYRPLKESLLNSADLVWVARAQGRYLFNFRHLVALLDRALRHLQTDPGVPVDLVQATRHARPVSPSLTSSLTEFLDGYDSPSAVAVEALPIIASSLVMDHYTLEMHRK